MGGFHDFLVTQARAPCFSRSVAPSRRCTAPLVPEGFWASDLNSDLSGPGLAPDLESSLGLWCGVVPGCCQGLETEVQYSARNSCALVHGLAVHCWRAHLCHQQAPPLLSRRALGLIVTFPVRRYRKPGAAIWTDYAQQKTYQFWLLTVYLGVFLCFSGFVHF